MINSFIKVEGKKGRAPDDALYNAHADLRENVARGNTVLYLHDKDTNTITYHNVVSIDLLILYMVLIYILKYYYHTLSNVSFMNLTFLNLCFCVFDKCSKTIL